MADFSPKAMRERYAELTEMAAGIRAKTDPLRAARDKFANKAREEEMRLNAEIKTMEIGLNGIDQERALIVRALGGKIVEPEAVA